MELFSASSMARVGGVDAGGVEGFCDGRVYWEGLEGFDEDAVCECECARELDDGEVVVEPAFKTATAF